MVREKKTRIKDIEKLHELIDSASLPKQKTLSPYETERLESLRKRLSDESYNDRRQMLASDVSPARSEPLTPQVVVHKKGEMKKKDERVIQIDFGPRDIKQEKKPEPSLVNFIYVKDDLFVSEPLYEIEKIVTAQQKFFEVTSVDHSEKPQTSVEFIPVAPVQKSKTEHLVEAQLGKKLHIFHKNPDKEVEKAAEVFTQKTTPIEIEQSSRSSFSKESKENIPLFEPVEFTVAIPEKREIKPLIGEIKQATDDKQKKREKKQGKLEVKHRITGKETKVPMELSQTRHLPLEEEKHREQPQTVTVTEKNDRDGQLLVHEPEDLSQQDGIGVLRKQREDRKRKKNEERQARLTLKEKKREAKRVSKEHDRKLKLEWIEFQHAQRQTQKTKSLEEKKAAVKKKEKEQEEQRLLKEREEKVRLDQLALRKKEKEEHKQKKREEKQAIKIAKEKEREAKRLAKEHERKLKFELPHTEQINQGTQKQKKLEPTHTTAPSEVKQKPLKEKTAKRTPIVAPIHPEKKKTTTEKTKIPQIAIGKKEKSRKKKTAGRKEESGITTWESFDEEVSEETDLPSNVVIEESPSNDTKKSVLALQKQEQKRLKRERKEQERLERRELKKKLKEQKIQKKVEEQKRRQLFDETRANRDQLKQKKIEEKLARRAVEEKNRNEKMRLQQEQEEKEKAFALKELRLKEKEREERKHKQVAEKKDRLEISKLSIGTAKDAGIVDERKKAEQQKNTMELVRIAAEEKEHRKTKAFEKKMEKERKKKERDEQKFRMKEEANAKKKMDVRMKEAVIKEKLTSQPERNDPFVAFDSIDQDIALILNNCGYTSIEKLRQASVKDLVKNGLKKKIAQRIIAECEEFVEWEVFDTTDH
ncbi:MAG: hypothetical protein JW840_10990 [Candidatus Thermoplasmatota archaeon]|nr:hypothetical protein [Candidatus Thermoplasmatota archaeon]